MTMMKRAPICGLAVLSLAAASPPKRLYLDPHSAMTRTAARLWGVARADAAVLSAAWFTGGAIEIRSRVDDLVSRGAAAAEMPVLVAYTGRAQRHSRRHR